MESLHIEIYGPTLVTFSHKIDDEEFHEALEKDSVLAMKQRYLYNLLNFPSVMPILNSGGVDKLLKKKIRLISSTLSDAMSFGDFEEHVIDLFGKFSHVITRRTTQVYEQPADSRKRMIVIEGIAKRFRTD
jgi:hypothetical protein